MKKAECEAAIRYLCHTFAQENSTPTDGSGNPSFSKFYGWLREEHGAYLNFRTTGSVSDAVERWWAEEMRQTWRY